MKTLTYSKPHDLGGLQDELIAQVPSLRPVDGPRGKEAVFSLSGGVTNAITLDVPSASNTAAIDAVVAAHDPAPYAASRQAAAQAAQTATANEGTLRGRVDQAVANLEDAWTNWATLSAAQKDPALRLSVRVAAGLARLQLRKLDSAG